MISAQALQSAELLARLRSLLRRQASVKDTVLEHRGMRLDLVGARCISTVSPWID